MNHANRSQGSVQPGEIFLGGPARHLSMPTGRPPAVAAAPSSSSARGPYVPQARPPPHAHRVHSAPAPGSFVGYARPPSLVHGASFNPAAAAPIGGPFGYGPPRPELRAPGAPAPIGGPFGYGPPQAQLAHRQPTVQPNSVPVRHPSAPALAPLLTPPGQSGAPYRWPDNSSAAPPATPAQYGQHQQGVTYGRAPPPPLPPPPRPPSPPPRSPFSPHPQSALYASQAPRPTSAPSAPTADVQDDELARVLELSKQSYETDERLRQQANLPVAPVSVSEPHADEDEELARALEESLQSGPAPEIEPLPLYEPVAPSAVPPAAAASPPRARSPLLQKADPAWDFSASGLSSVAVQRSASDNILPVPIRPPRRTSSAKSFGFPPLDHTDDSYGSARTLESSSPLPSPSAATAGQHLQPMLAMRGFPPGGPSSMRANQPWSSLQPAQDDVRRQTPTSSSYDRPSEAAHGQSFASGADDLHVGFFDGGLIWGQTTLQPPSLAPLSVQHGLPLPHHSKGAVYVIAPSYPDILTSLFALSNTLIEGGEETRLAVQFVQMADAEGDGCVTILWIESGALEDDDDAGQPSPPRRMSTASSALSVSSTGSSQARRPSGHRLPPPLPETFHPPVKPSTGTYSSAHLIFQHPAFAARSHPRPRPRPQSTLIALPPSAVPLLAIGDLLAHLLGLTPYALSDALSLLSSDRRRPATGPQLMWSPEDRERFLALIKQHTPEAPETTGLDDDDDDESDRFSTAPSLKGSGKREKERSKRRWIKEHLSGVGTGSLSRQSHPHFVHPDQQQLSATQQARLPAPPKKKQVAEVAAFITPFAFPSDTPP